MLKELLRVIKPKKKTPILVYHKIDEIPKAIDKFRLSVSPRSFNKQMEYLSRSKNCITLADLVSFLKNGKAVPSNSAVLTFDDGYLDNYSNAIPILKRYGLKATFFIPTDYVGSTNKWDESLGEIRSKIMSWKDINNMSLFGMEIGSHGCSHGRMTSFSNKNLEKEIKVSREILETKLNKEINLFSFPYGDSNLRTSRFVQSCGYIAACSDQRLKANGFYLYNLNRIPVYPYDTFNEFKSKVSGWYEWRQDLLNASKLPGIKRRLNRILS